MMHLNNALGYFEILSAFSASKYIAPPWSPGRLGRERRWAAASTKNDVCNLFNKVTPLLNWDMTVFLEVETD